MGHKRRILAFIYSQQLNFRRCCKLTQLQSCTACTLLRLACLRLAKNPIAVSILPCWLLSSCLLGPNFRTPPPPPVKRYTEVPMPSATVSAPTATGEKQAFKTQSVISREWWHAFHSKALNEMVGMALKANPDLRAATATLKAAHENTLAQRAVFFPVLTAEDMPTRELTPATLSSNLASNAYLYTVNIAQLSISYVPDIFGVNRRQVESLRAQEEATCFERDAVYLTLTTNVILTAIQEASLRAQIRALERAEGVAKKQLNIVQKQRRLGHIGPEVVSAQAALLARIESEIPPLHKQLAYQRHQLATFCGKFPGEGLVQRFELDALTLPKTLPLRLPAALVRARPDIRAAEANVHAAAAEVGVAVANRFPNLSLSGVGGYEPVDYAVSSIPANSLLFPGLTGTQFWTLSGNLAGTIFDFGYLLHKQRAAVAEWKSAMAEYEGIVLVAFRNIANVLKAIETDADALKFTYAETEAASNNLRITQGRWKLGATSHLAVLAAQEAYQEALVELAQARASRFSDTAMLYQALGGAG